MNIIISISTKKNILTEENISNTAIAFSFFMMRINDRKSCENSTDYQLNY